MRTSLLPLLLLSPLAFASGSNSHKVHKRAHRRALARTPEEERNVEIVEANHNATLAKRQSFTGRGTFYYTDVGLGACGQHHGNDEWTVALNSPQYGGGYPGPQCFKSITISANGQTRSGIKIMDECPTCDWGGLDLSPGLFTQFAGYDAGVIQVTWWFDGSGPQPTTTQQPTTTWHEPTTTWTPPSSTWSPPPASSSTTTTTSTTSSTWTTTTTTSPSSSSSTTSLSSTSSFNATTNPFAVVSSINGTASSTSLSASGSASNSGASASASASGAAGSGAPLVVLSQGNNLEAINGLVTNYGQIIVVGAGGYNA